MPCSSQSGNNWFRACAQGDISLVERLKARKKGIYDNRPSSGNGSIFKGFVGLHYASYFDRLDVVRSLLDLEYDKVTQYSVLIYPPSHSTPMEVDTPHGVHFSAGAPIEKQAKTKQKRSNLQIWSHQSAVSHTEIFDTNTNLRALRLCTTLSIHSISCMSSDRFDYISSSPMTPSSNNSQPFTLDKGSSALMIAIVRRNFKLAKYIIDWLRDRRKDSKKLSSMLKLQNASSMSALMLLCTMRASAAAAAILQSGDLMLLHHEFVLLSKEGKSCLHYCIDSGSYLILETIFLVMCDRHAETDEGYMLKYRLAQMLLYDKSIPKLTVKPDKLARTPSNNAFSIKDDSSPTRSSFEGHSSDDQIIDLGNVYTACYSSIGELASDQQRQQRAHINMEGSKSQTLLDYVLYQTSSLSPEARSRIYALVYHYSKKVYLWAVHDYINICRTYSSMTPDIAFLQHVKRWVDFEERYPKPQVPYSPANKDLVTEPCSSLSARQSISVVSLHLSPILSTDITVRSASKSGFHRRCLSLSSIAAELPPSGPTTVSTATCVGTLSSQNRLQLAYMSNPLVRSSTDICNQEDDATFHSLPEDDVRDSKPALQETGFKKRKNSVQHLLVEDNPERTEECDNTNSQQIASNTSSDDAIDSPITGMNTARRIVLLDNTETDKATSTSEALPIPCKTPEESSNKNTITSITLPSTKFSDGSVTKSSSTRSPGSVQHNAFRQPRELLKSASLDNGPDSLSSDNCTCSCTTSTSDFNGSCRSIIRFNDSASFEKESDSERNSVINITSTPTSE